MTARRGHHGLDTTNTKLYTPQLHPCAHSLRTGARHRCACVFLVGQESRCQNLMGISLQKAVLVCDSI